MARRSKHRVVPPPEEILAFIRDSPAPVGKRELEELRRHGQALADDIARVHIALGQLDRAFEWLDKALDERALFVVYLKVDPSYEPLRSDERY